MAQLEVRTDHQIVPFGSDMMQLCDSRDGSVIVTATRDGDHWTISAGDDTVTAGDRGETIQAMCELAYRTLGPNDNDDIPGDGYSTLVPHGLTDVP